MYDAPAGREYLWPAADIVGVIVNGSLVQEMRMEDIRSQYSNGLEEYFFEATSGGI